MQNANRIGILSSSYHHGFTHGLSWWSEAILSGDYAWEQSIVNYSKYVWEQFIYEYVVITGWEQSIKWYSYSRLRSDHASFYDILLLENWAMSSVVTVAHAASGAATVPVLACWYSCGGTWCRAACDFGGVALVRGAMHEIRWLFTPQPTLW